MTRTPNPLAIKSLCPSGRPSVGQRTSTGPAEKEPQSAYGPGIAQAAFQSIGMSTRNFGGPFIGPPEYALAVSLIFTKATEQTIMLGTPPNHVCSTSILWNSLAHDKRFTLVAISESAPGDIIIEPGWKKAADGNAGIVVDHGRIVSNSRHGVQNDSSLIEIQSNRQEMAIFRSIGVQGRRSYSLANTGYNDDEPRLPAGQPGGGQWTTGGAGTASDDDNLKTAGEAAKETAQARIPMGMWMPRIWAIQRKEFMNSRISRIPERATLGNRRMWTRVLRLMNKTGDWSRELKRKQMFLVDKRLAKLPNIGESRKRPAGCLRETQMRSLIRRTQLALSDRIC